MKTVSTSTTAAMPGTRCNDHGHQASWSSLLKALILVPIAGITALLLPYVARRMIMLACTLRRLSWPPHGAGECAGCL